MLVIPRQPIAKLADASEADKALLGHLMWVAGEVARQAGVEEAFRLVVNNGRAAGPDRVSSASACFSRSLWQSRFLRVHYINTYFLRALATQAMLITGTKQ